jgi:hypothetical protein
LECSTALVIAPMETRLDLVSKCAAELGRTAVSGPGLPESVCLPGARRRSDGGRLCERGTQPSHI